MDWLAKLNDDPLPWLLEPDPANPGVRYFALRDLLDRPADDPELRHTQADVMLTGPVRAILDAQAPDGHWSKPGAGYLKYTGTVWSVVFLAMFGADGRDAAVRRGCDYVLDHSRARAPYGGFSAMMELYPMGMIQCLGGNLCAALIDLGWRDDPRLGEALAWLARSITGEGIVPADEAPPRSARGAGEDEVVRYFKGGNSGPGFECAANSRKPCAWGAVKAMLALSRIPEPERTPTMQEAVTLGVDFLLGCDPVTADYPTPYGQPPSRSWFQFGYPLGYVTDVLQNLEALAALGRGGDPRLANALTWLLAKQDAAGRWKMEYTYNGKMWQDVEQKGQPSKWVTLRALRVLKRAA